VSEDTNAAELPNPVFGISWRYYINEYILANSSEFTKCTKIDKSLTYVKPKIQSTACSFDVIFPIFVPYPECTRGHTELLPS
jgi:hypothetical protein